MRTLSILIVLILLVAPTRAAVTLRTEHVDLSTNYNAALGQWQLTARDGNNTTEYAAGEAILHVGLEARVEVPDQPEFAFLGAPGSSSWILPKTQEDGLLYLGVASENKTAAIQQSGWEGVGVSRDFLVRGYNSGTFLNNEVTLRLAAFSGPGHFALYDPAGFGLVEVAMNTRDGITNSDALILGPNTHKHYDWAFSAPGTYFITLQASGLLASGGGTLTQSELTTFQFVVVPEPATASLLVLGTAFLARRLRRS